MLNKIEAAGYDVFQERISLSKGAKLGLMARAWLTGPLDEVTDSHGDAEPSALVIGGGLAGIAAAARLAESGWRVTLLEARNSLGGRAFSFVDPESGRELDNGQHVFVGACRNLIEFLERIGVSDRWHLQPRLNVDVYDRAGRGGKLYGLGGPAPAHLLAAFVTYRHLSLGDKLRAVRGVIAAMRADRSTPEMETTSFYDWLRAHGQSERCIYNLWNVIIEGTLNDNIRDVSAAMGLMITQDGLLRGRREINLGYPKAPLGQAVGMPSESYLRSLGVAHAAWLSGSRHRGGCQRVSAARRGGEPPGVRSQCLHKRGAVLDLAQFDPGRSGGKKSPSTR